MIGGEACKSEEMGLVSIWGAENIKASVYQMGIVLQWSIYELELSPTITESPGTTVLNLRVSGTLKNKFPFFICYLGSGILQLVQVNKHTMLRYAV